MEFGLKGFLTGLALLSGVFIFVLGYVGSKAAKKSTVVNKKEPMDKTPLFFSAGGKVTMYSAKWKDWYIERWASSMPSGTDFEMIFRVLELIIEEPDFTDRPNWDFFYRRKGRKYPADLHKEIGLELTRVFSRPQILDELSPLEKNTNRINPYWLGAKKWESMHTLNTCVLLAAQQALLQGKLPRVTIVINVKVAGHYYKTYCKSGEPFNVEYRPLLE